MNIAYPVVVFKVTRSLIVDHDEDMNEVLAPDYQIGSFPVADYNTVDLTMFLIERGWLPKDWVGNYEDDLFGGVREDLEQVGWFLYGIGKGYIHRSSGRPFTASMMTGTMGIEVELIEENNRYIERLMKWNHLALEKRARQSMVAVPPAEMPWELPPYLLAPS